MTNEKEIRINRFLSMCRLGSRRECEKFVINNKIKINGEIITELSQKVDINNDTVEYNGKTIKPIFENIHIILNKPIGYITSKSNYNTKSVYSLLTGFPKNLAYSGRLDVKSQGLLFFSTNGDLINKLAHPKYKMSKIYLVKTSKILSEQDLNKFRSGIKLKEKTTQKANIDIIDPKIKLYRIILKEGLNRQIRRMLEYLDCEALTIKRVAYGPIKLGNLKPGMYRKLTKNEIGKLKRNLNLNNI